MRWKTLAALSLAVPVAGFVASSGDLSRVQAVAEEGRPLGGSADPDEHLEEHPVDPEAMFLRALLLAEAQRQDEARELFEEVAAIRPDRPEPLNNLAVIQAAMGDYDAAVETLKEALRTHLAYRTAYENLTKIYGQLASEAYSRALSVDGAQDRSYLELVLLSKMVLPEVTPVQVAQVPVEPLPQAAEAAMAPFASKVAVDSDEGAVGIEKVDLVSEPPAVTGEASPPGQAIVEARNRGRDVEPAPMVMDEDESAGSKETDSQPESIRPAAPPPEPAELVEVVEAWARAWSEQRVEDYLYFYSRDFRPVGGMSRGDWAELRRARLAAPGFVKVSVFFLGFELVGPERARVRFNQSYESDTFSDFVAKTLELVREDGGWKIARESIDSQRQTDQ